MKWIRLCAVFAFLVLGAKSQAKSKLPEWLEKAAEAPNPAFDVERPPEVVVLWDEAVYDFQEDGSLLTTARFAIRIVEPQGRKRARKAVEYIKGSEKVLRVNAWNIDPEGEVHVFKASEIKDVSAVGYSLYSEQRAKLIDGASKARVGSVFAYEYTREEKSIFSQHGWWFQSSIPVLLSRLKINVPDGWSVKDTRFHDAPAPVVEGSSYVWEMTGLPAVKQQKYAPQRSVGRSFITVDVLPPADDRIDHSTLTFGTWEDISNYTAEIQDPQAEPSPEIKDKVVELTSGREDLWSKIQALGDYVKEMRYASISMDLSSGGGYTPRAASEVYKVGYGDCKDKANLLRSMLDALGIRSYPVVVNATNNDAVYPDWPSTYYFNHCILAVEVDDSVDTPAMIEHEKLGRILFVDATSSLTPIGELPFDEQGGLVVVGKRGLDELVRLPQAPPEANLTKREVKAELLPNGGLIGLASDVYHGRKADEERVLRLKNDDKEYKAVYERWVSEGNSSPVVELKSVEDRAATDRSFKVELEFGIPSYGKSMRNQLLVFKPVILSRLEGHPFLSERRFQPVRLEPSLLEEEALIYLPLGYKVDEMKESIVVETDFASYSATLRQEEDKLIYERKVRFEDALLSVDRYPELQAFYRAIIDADQTPVVLIRSGS